MVSTASNSASPPTAMRSAIACVSSSVSGSSAGGGSLTGARSTTRAMTCTACKPPPQRVHRKHAAAAVDEGTPGGASSRTPRRRDQTRRGTTRADGANDMTPRAPEAGERGGIPLARHPNPLFVRGLRKLSRNWIKLVEA
jgi:hypothetical protein